MTTLILGCILVIPSPRLDARGYLKLLEMSRFIAAHPTFEDTTAPYDAVHYEIHIKIFPTSHYIEGYTASTVAVRDTLDVLSLHFRGYTIDSIKIDSSAVGYSRTDTTIELTLPSQALPGDTLTAHVWYRGTPPSTTAGFNGGIVFDNGYVFVAFDLDIGRAWFPCHDTPSDKATVDQYIEAPLDYFVVANGSLVEVDTLDSSVVFHWREGYPIATYLTVFAAYNHFAHIVDTAYVNGTPVPVHGWVARWDSSRRANRLVNVPDMVEYFSEVYGAYPFIGEKFSNVDVPLGYAMENQTNVFIDMDLNWGRNWDWVLAHELSHQWWGDCVTLGTWADVWLNEGFATYSEAINAYRTGGMAAYHSYIRNNIMNYYIANEPYPPYPIYNPGSIWRMYSVVTYEKGASVLHMLRHIVGDSVFFEILRTYRSRFEYGNAVTSEFHAVAEEVSGIDLDWFFDEWVYSPGYPKYRYGWDVWPVGDSFDLVLQIDQIQSHNYGVPTFKMPIDVEIVFESGETLRTVVWDSLDSQVFRFTFAEAPRSVVIDPDDWILCRKYTSEIVEAEPAQPIDAKEIRISLDGDLLNVAFESEHDGYKTLEIFDIAGRLVAQKGIFAKVGQNVVQIRMTACPDGVYFVKVGDRTQKFLFMR